MTTTEQRTTGLFPHQNERKPLTAVSCVASNVGSITDFLFSSPHSILSTSSNIPTNEIEQQPSTESPSSPLPQILIHTTSEQCINMNQQLPSGNISQISVRKRRFFFLYT